MRKFTLLLLAFVVTGHLFAQLQMSSSNMDSQFERNTKEVAFHDQLQTPEGSMASQQFPDFGNSRLQAADDFTVPSGLSWDLSRVEIFGITNSGLPIPAFPTASFIIEIYEDNGGLPAASPLFMQDGLSFTESSGLYSISLNTPLNIPPGNYWICVMPNMEFGLYGQLFWSTFSGTQVTNKFAVQDPDFLLGGGYPITWEYGDFVWPGVSAYNACFALYGEDAPPPSVPLNNWALIIGGMLIIGFTLVRVKMMH